jgi:hypothetical protein
MKKKGDFESDRSGRLTLTEIADGPPPGRLQTFYCSPSIKSPAQKFARVAAGEARAKRKKNLWAILTEFLTKIPKKSAQSAARRAPTIR